MQFDTDAMLLKLVVEQPNALCVEKVEDTGAKRVVFLFEVFELVGPLFVAVLSWCSVEP